MHNAADSILFLRAARNAVCETITVSETADRDFVPEMINFVQNEATDYQVMSLMMDNELPEEKHNIVAEGVLFERYRDGILEDYASYQESYGNQVANSLLFEIGPVSPYGIDTATPVLNHLYESGLAHILIEKGKKDAIKKLAGDAGALAATGSKKVRDAAGNLVSKSKVQGGNLKRAFGAAKSNPVGSKMSAQSMGGKLGVAMGKGVAAGKAAAKGAGKAAVGAKDLAVKGARGAGGAVAKGARGVAGGATNVVKSVGKGYSGLANTGKTGAGVTGKIGRTIGKGAKAAVTGAKGAAKFAGSTAGKALGAAAVAAAAIYAGYKVYKTYLSKAARACAGSKGGEKAACMQKYKNTAIKAQMSAVRAGAGKCNQAKDPAKCKAAIANK